MTLYLEGVNSERLYASRLCVLLSIYIPPLSILGIEEEVGGTCVARDI
jgi:hypothetical protein